MPVIDILFFLFLFITIIQVAYYVVFIFSYTSKPVNSPNTNTNQEVSVIICAKNEVENLKNNLKTITTQQHKNFEIVLVNDASIDESLRVMREWEDSHDNIKIVDVKNIEKFWGNKKYALTLGIKAASHNTLLFTDADCHPKSRNWISIISGCFSSTKTIVLGYGGYIKTKGLLNKLIRFETVLTAIQYFSYANLGRPYMGVGRNLGYTKNLFYHNSGFMHHMEVISGDDDLFVNQAATSENTIICDHPDAHTLSEPETTFKKWIAQKRRHILTSHHYKSFDQFWLGFFFFSQWSFIVLSTSLLIWSEQWEIVTGLLFLRYSIVFITYRQAFKKLKETKLLIITPILELILIFTQFYIFIANLISKPKHWN